MCEFTRFPIREERNCQQPLSTSYVHFSSARECPGLGPITGRGNGTRSLAGRAPCSEMGSWHGTFGNRVLTLHFWATGRIGKVKNGQKQHLNWRKAPAHRNPSGR